jgi:hypothetical protein
MTNVFHHPGREDPHEKQGQHLRGGQGRQNLPLSRLKEQSQRCCGKTTQVISFSRNMQDLCIIWKRESSHFI